MIVTGPGAGNAGDSAIAAVRSAIARLMPGVGARRSSARDPSECLHGHACLTRWCGALRVGALHDRQALSGPGERGWLQAWAGRAQGRDVQKAKGRSQPEARARAGAEHVYAAPATPVVASMAATTQLIGQDAGSATSAGDPGAGPAAASPAYPDGDGDSGDSTPAPPSGGGSDDTATAGRRLLQAQARCTRRRRRTRAPAQHRRLCLCRFRQVQGLARPARLRAHRRRRPAIIGSTCLQSPLRSRNLAHYSNPATLASGAAQAARNRRRERPPRERPGRCTSRPRWRGTHPRRPRSRRRRSPRSRPRPPRRRQRRAATPRPRRRRWLRPRPLARACRRPRRPRRRPCPAPSGPSSCSRAQTRCVPCAPCHSRALTLPSRASLMCVPAGRCCLLTRAAAPAPRWHQALYVPGGESAAWRRRARAGCRCTPHCRGYDLGPCLPSRALTLSSGPACAAAPRGSGGAASLRARRARWC